MHGQSHAIHDLSLLNLFFFTQLMITDVHLQVTFFLHKIVLDQLLEAG
jgi:hypothetical protein